MEEKSSWHGGEEQLAWRRRAAGMEEKSSWHGGEKQLAWRRRAAEEARHASAEETRLGGGKEQLGKLGEQAGSHEAGEETRIAAGSECRSSEAGDAMFAAGGEARFAAACGLGSREAMFASGVVKAMAACRMFLGFIQKLRRRRGV